MKFTLLTEDQIWGRDNFQSIRAQEGKPYASDLCLGLGSWGYSLARTGIGGHDNLATTLVDGTYGNATEVWHMAGDRNNCGEDDPKNSIRPVITGADAEAVYQAGTNKKVEKINGYFVETFEYGEYPQDVDWDYGELEHRFKDGTLKMTGKQYTFNSLRGEDDYGWSPQNATEYELNGQKYVRAIVSSFGDSLYLDGCRACNGYPCWYKVQPIKWMREPDGTLIAQKALVSSVPMSKAKDYVTKIMPNEIEPSGSSNYRPKVQKYKHLKDKGKARAILDALTKGKQLPDNCTDEDVLEAIYRLSKGKDR